MLAPPMESCMRMAIGTKVREAADRMGIITRDGQYRCQVFTDHGSAGVTSVDAEVEMHYLCRDTPDTFIIIYDKDVSEGRTNTVVLDTCRGARAVFIPVTLLYSQQVGAGGVSERVWKPTIGVATYELPAGGMTTLDRSTVEGHETRIREMFVRNMNNLGPAAATEVTLVDTRVSGELTYKKGKFVNSGDTAAHIQAPEGGGAS